MTRYALTVFLSAFLLFQVQPMLGRYILPWFGGGPAVWTTCLLFFQVALLVGYSYAHLLARFPRRWTQAGLHLVLLGVSLLFLPIGPAAGDWKPATGQEPVGWILLLLGANIGVPYLLLSSTGPLLQRWFSHSFPQRSPYRLYALSNAGSLLALLTYPFVIEPLLTLSTQVAIWSWAFVAFVICCGWCALRIWRLRAPEVAATVEVAQPKEEGSDQGSPTTGTLLMWLLLPACGSAALLATTNQICQEIAVVPFLWILPLCLYLLTFIISFDNERWYDRRWFGGMMPIIAPLVCYLLFSGVSAKLWIQLSVYLAALFVCCMVCHGELVRIRPSPRYLTLFYLAIAAGGALGGVFVALLAPYVFPGFWEYHLSFAGCYVLALVSWYRNRVFKRFSVRPIWIWGPMGFLLLALLVALGYDVVRSTEDVVHTSRGFYGVLRIVRREGSKETKLLLKHGRIAHGFQYQGKVKRYLPTSYYGPDSAVGLVLEHHPRRRGANPPEGSLRIGVVGLGTGTLAAYGRPGDSFRFYEIDPQVVNLSKEYFTYCSDSPADVEVVTGDARIRLEEELARSQPNRFDVLAVDAFSSDAIPVHLLTRECVDIYWQHLTQDGILLLHISNRFVNLGPVSRGLGQWYNCEVARISSDEDSDAGLYAATWVVLTRNKEFLEVEEVEEAVDGWPDEDMAPILWTDDFTSLWQVLKFG